MFGVSYQGRRAKRTKYRNVWFKSRLESQWARYFDKNGIQWKYEPRMFQIDTHRFYLPDFLLLVDDLTIVGEVKPTWQMAVGDLRISALSRQVENMCLALAGDPLFAAPRRRKGPDDVQVFMLDLGEVVHVWEPANGLLVDWLRYLHERWAYGSGG
jgi:hypothetical protein